MLFKCIPYNFLFTAILAICSLKAYGQRDQRSDTTFYNNQLVTDFYSDDQEVYLPLYGDYRDYFSQASTFGYSFLRFRARGYSSRYTEERWNGLLFDDFWNDAPRWSALTGLSSTPMVQSSARGLSFDALGCGIGSLGGSHEIYSDHSYSKRLRGSYSFSNRVYTNRLTAQYQSGVVGKGWNATAELSRRWGRSLSIDGVFADSWSALANVGKEINPAHCVEMTFFFAPNERATAAASTDEAYALTSNNLYNPSWGYQNGKQRSARVSTNMTPIFIAGHTWKPNDQTRLFTSATASIGTSSYSALNWQTAPNPNPDYYKYLPSGTSSPFQAEIITQQWQSDPSVRQINYDALYDFNQSTGDNAHYIIENRVRQTSYFGAQTTFNTMIGRTIISGGLGAYYTSEKRYKTIEDLLGAKYWTDIDYFVEQDDDYKVFTQNNMANPNRHIIEDERFGYNYRLQHLNANAWISAEHHIKSWYFRAAASLNYTTLSRFGQWEKQLFPDKQSLGESPTLQNMEGAVKIGFEYRLGKKFSAALSLLGQKLGPTAQNSFFDANYRNTFIPDLRNETILSADLSFRYITTDIRGSASLYYTSISDQTQLLHLYDDRQHLYSDFVLQNISTRHMGLEFGLEVRLYDDLWIRGAASLSDNRYTNNPTASIYYQTTGRFLTSESINYKNLHTSLSPQTIGSLSFAYEPYGWTASITLNGFARSYITPSPTHYTADAISKASKPIEMVGQEQFPSGFTLDLFGGRTFTLPNSSRIGVYAGLNNITNNKGIKTGGYQSHRLLYSDGKYSPQASKYYYALGFNGFINISYTF